jgi:hypothetical protein
MRARFSCLPRRLSRVLAQLALPALVLAACDAVAQRQNVSVDEYRLSMPMLRKVLPVLYAPRMDTCPRRAPREVAAMSVAEMQEQIEHCAPVQRAAAAHGVTTREVALVSKALMQVGIRMAEEESAKATGGTPAPLPPGVLRDNVALVRQNEAELGRLTRRSD